MKYFISYNLKTKHGFGFGNCMVDVDRIVSMKNIEEAHKLIKNNILDKGDKDIENIIILNYIEIVD
jgi:hypothetical protein